MRYPLMETSDLGKKTPILFLLLLELGRFSALKLFLLLSFFLPLNIAYTQSAEIDKLKTKLHLSESKADQINILHRLSKKLKNLDSNQALTYAQQALKLAQQTNDIKNEVKAMYNIGTLIYDSPLRDSAFTYFENGERLASQHGLGELHAQHLMSIANWYRYHKIDSAKTVEHLLKSIEISKEANYSYGLGRSYAKLASFYTRYQEIELCEKYLELCVAPYLQVKNGKEDIAHYYNEVGNKIWDYDPKKSMGLYFKGLKFSPTHPNLKVSLAKAYNSTGKAKISIKYLEEAIATLEAKEDYGMKGLAIARLAEIYAKLGDDAKALKTCDEGVAFLSKLSLSNQRGLLPIYRTKGHLMERAGNRASALEFYTKSLDLSRKIKLGAEIVKSNIVLGNFYASSNPQKSRYYSKKALKGAQKNNFINLNIEACETLYQRYKEEKNYSTALKYFEQKSSLLDSLNSLNIEHALDINNRLTEKDKQLAVQSYEKKIKEEQLKTQYTVNNYLVLFILFGLVFTGVLAKGYLRIRRQRSEINEKTQELIKVNQSLEHSNAEINEKTQQLIKVNQNLERSNNDLERFAHVTSHDLKAPLRSIVGFSKIMRKKLGRIEDPSINECLTFIEDSGIKMNQLIGDILEFSKLSGNQNIDKETIKLNELVNELIQITQASQESESINFEVSALPEINWYYSKIFLLFKNLIENGIKYNKADIPTIKIYCKGTSENTTIFVEDNGIGIKKEYFDEIFEMFRRLHSESEFEGTGLGLATCKKIVDEFEGKIGIESKVNEGTTFKITIPGGIIRDPSKHEIEDIQVLENHST